MHHVTAGEFVKHVSSSACIHMHHILECLHTCLSRQPNCCNSCVYTYMCNIRYTQSHTYLNIQAALIQMCVPSFYTSVPCDKSPGKHTCMSIYLSKYLHAHVISGTTSLNVHTPHPSPLPRALALLAAATSAKQTHCWPSRVPPSLIGRSIEVGKSNCRL